jgi:hypothetical protein
MKFSAYILLGVFWLSNSATAEICEAVQSPKIDSIRELASLLPTKLFKPKAWEIPFYDRSLNNSNPSEILCITSRDGTTLQVLGHTALSRFKLNQSSTGKKKLVAHEVNAIGLWPVENLLNNSSKDHFLNFEHSQEKRNNVSFCVTINESESKRLDQFIEERKHIRWTLGYNCNDFSTEAFKFSTGISLASRSASAMFLSNPVKVSDSIKKMKETQASSKIFTYLPKGEGEINNLLELEKEQKLKTSPFRNR